MLALIFSQSSVLAAPPESDDAFELSAGRFLHDPEVTAGGNIQIYDPHVVDLYQWVFARYLVGVNGAETQHRQSAVKLGSLPNFRTDHAGFRKPCPAQKKSGDQHRKTRIYIIFQ